MITMQEIVNANGNENAANHIVVVGTIAGLSDTQITVAYDTGAMTQHITGNRADLGGSGSIGVALANTDDQSLKAFSFKRCECPQCNNNNAGVTHDMTKADLEEVNARRVAFEDEDGNKQWHKCAMCNGSGFIKELPSGMNPLYDVEWDDTVQSLRDGHVPAQARQQFQSMLLGGRSGKTDQWDVEISPKKLMALDPTGNAIACVPEIIQHYNEMYASPEMPHGMPVGRTKTGVYATVQHREVLLPWMALCAERGLDYSLYGTNHGQDAYLQIKLTDNGTKADIIEALKGAEGINYMRGQDREGNDVPLSQDPRSMISFGIQIRSSFDGAITFMGVAERLACTNGMVTTEKMNLLTLSHKKGAIESMKFDLLADAVLQAALSLWDEISHVERMNDFLLDDTDVERLAVIMKERKIITWPGLGKAKQLTGGRVFRAMVEGWNNPQASRNGASFVAVGGDDPGVVKSLNHFYNVLTGITTHQIDANDIHGKVTGGKAISMDATTKTLKEIHALCREVQISAETAWNEYKFDSANKDAPLTLKEYVAQFGIPMLEEMQPLNENGGFMPNLEYRDADGNVAHEHQLTLRYQAPLVA